MEELKLEVPTLTIGDVAEAAAEAPAPVEEAPTPVKEIPIEDRIELTPEEQKVVDDGGNVLWDFDRCNAGALVKSARSNDLQGLR